MSEEVDLESSVYARVGSVIVGKYRLDRVLGIGGMAAVYAATHRNQAEFAVKMLHAELSQSQDVRSRFLREGYIANSVKHAGAVRVVDDDVAEDGSAFLVMELLHGVSAEDMWFRAERRVPVRPVLVMADQLLDVLAAAHAKNIVHRDIKPANLFVTNEGDLKVLDFGIARLRDTAGALHATTQAGTMLGTPAFMSPEQALGRSKEIDGQTDQWAVGATLFALISGRLVHEADTAPQLLLRAASSHARPLASVATDVPPLVGALVDRALAFDKAARWPGAAAMRTALREAFEATFHDQMSRGELAAYLRSGESAPPPPAGHTSAPPRASQHPTESLAKTKIERLTPQSFPGAPVVGASVPAAPASTGLTTSTPVSAPAAAARAAAPPSVPPAPQRATVAVVVGAVVVLVALAVGAFVLLRGHDRGAATAPLPALSAVPGGDAGP